jgi:hypothetical protein
VCVLHTYQFSFSQSGVAKFLVVLDFEIFRAHTSWHGFSREPERILFSPSRVKLPRHLPSIIRSGVAIDFTVLEFSTRCTFSCTNPQPWIFSSCWANPLSPFSSYAPVAILFIRSEGEREILNGFWDLISVHVFGTKPKTSNFLEFLRQTSQPLLELSSSSYTLHLSKGEREIRRISRRTHLWCLCCPKYLLTVSCTIRVFFHDGP